MEIVNFVKKKQKKKLEHTLPSRSVRPGRTGREAWADYPKAWGGLGKGDK